MTRRNYRCAVLALLAASLAGCSNQFVQDSGAFDIGSGDDMAIRQDQSRLNRPIPRATEMPPGLGEDLPIQDAPAATAPLTKNQ